MNTHSGMQHVEILLVEDSPTDALLISEVVADIPDFEYELHTVERLVDGIAAIKDRHIDVVLLDLGLPGSRGIETFRAFHQQAPDLPILVLTALDDIAVGLLALSEGAQDYLIKKNIQTDILGRAIRYAIGRQELYIELRQSRDRLRKLATHLQTVRERERTRISREIHDELGQKMTALKMDLHWIEKKISPSLASQSREVLVKRIHESEYLVDKVVQTIQRIAIELRPSALDHLGLLDAIRDESRRFEANTGIRVELLLPATLKINDIELSTTFFRIYQELLTNIARHARAKTVTVKFTWKDNIFALDVTDDGIGMQTGKRIWNTSLGILGMRERAATHGGSIHFDGKAGQGTQVLVKIPVVEDEVIQEC